MSKLSRSDWIRIVLAVALVGLSIGLFIRAPIYYDTVVLEEGGSGPESIYRALLWGPWLSLALAFGILVRQTPRVVYLLVIAALLSPLWPQVY